MSARNDADNIGYDARVVLGSNISENVDFTLSWRTKNGGNFALGNEHKTKRMKGIVMMTLSLIHI